MPPGGFLFGDDGFGGGGGEMLGGVIGGPIGAVIGAWVGSKLGKALRGRRSPEEFVDDMIKEGRIPEFLNSILTRDRLIATERQSRGAGSVLDLTKTWVNDRIADFDSGNENRIENGKQAMFDHERELRSRAQSEPDKALYYVLAADVLHRIGTGVAEAQQNQAGGGTSYGGGSGAGGYGGGSAGGSTSMPSPAPGTVNKAALGVIAVVVVIGLMLGSK